MIPGHLAASRCLTATTSYAQEQEVAV